MDISWLSQELNTFFSILDRSAFVARTKLQNRFKLRSPVWLWTPTIHTEEPPVTPALLRNVHSVMGKLCRHERKSWCFKDEREHEHDLLCSEFVVLLFPVLFWRYVHLCHVLCPSLMCFTWVLISVWSLLVSPQSLSVFVFSWLCYLPCDASLACVCCVLAHFPCNLTFFFFLW